MGVVGCSCDEESERAAGTGEGGPPPPLEETSVPSGIGAQVFAPVGATDERPVALVLAEETKYCERTRAVFQGRAHVICSGAKPEAAERELKAALRFLKDSYPRHVAPPPVIFIVDPPRAEVGWELMLKEPSFFSNAYLPGLEEKALTSTTLSALHDRGGRNLVLELAQSNRLKLLARVAARRGLVLHPLGPKGDTLGRALSILSKAEPRLGSKKPPARQEP